MRPVELAQILKTILRIRHTPCRIGELTVWVDPASNFGSRLLRDGHYEPDTTALLTEILRPGDTFFDVGGNEGWFSLLAGRAVGRTGRVLCVEPQERLWPVVLRNFAANDLSQCVLVPLAISDSPNPTRLILTPDVNSGASTLVARGRFRHYRRQEVPTRRLDDLAALYQVDEVRLVKIDVEGFEQSVLRSSARLLRERRIDSLLVEVHARQQPDADRGARPADAIVELMASFGYRCSGSDTLCLFTRS